MAAILPDRRAFLRAVHETWGVPIEVIAEIGRYLPHKLAQIAQVDGWVATRSPEGLRIRLIDVLEASLSRIIAEDAPAPDEEKRARALASMAKTLETIQALGQGAEPNATGPATNAKGRLADECRVEGNDADDDDFAAGLAGGTRHTLDLDRRIAALVADIARSEEGGGGRATEGA